MHLISKSFKCLAAIAGAVLLIPFAMGPAVQAASEAPSSTAESILRGVDISGVQDSASNHALAVSLSRRLAESADPVAMLKSIPQTELKTLAAYMLPASTVTTRAIRAATASETPKAIPTESTIGVSPLSLNCWVANSYMYTQNSFSNNLFSTQLQARWCSNGTSTASTVSAASLVNSWGQTYWVGWSHVGRIGTASGVIGNSARTYVQHKFTFGTGGWILYESTPCHRNVGFGNGSSVQQSICGIY